jgi:Neuraminidase (sialidase)
MLLHTRFALAFAAASLLFVSPPASAQSAAPAPTDTVVPAPRVAATAPQFRPPFMLNSHSPSAPVSNIYGGPEVEQNSSVATDGAGHWIAVWHSTDTLQGRSGRDYDILVARSIDNGITWSAPAALNTNAQTDYGDDLAPFVRTDEGGVWIAAWMSTETFGGKYGLDRDLFFARSLDNGQTWSDPAPLNTNAAQDWGDDYEPRLATDGSGNWVAVWSSSDSLGNRIGGDRDILVSRSTDSGQTWTHPMPLNNNASADKGFDTSPDIVTDASGRWLCAWSAGDSGIQGIGTDRDILIARSDDKGATWTDPAPLNSNATSDENSDWTPRLASDGRGNWVAVWSSADSLGDTIGVDRDILVSRSTDNGTSWSTARALNRNAAGDAREDAAPSIASDGTGNWLVIWQAWGGLSYRDGSDADIAVAYSMDDGASWTDPVHINEHAMSDDVDDILPSLATDGAGHWVATWQSFHPPDETAKTSEWRLLAAAGLLENNAAPSPGPNAEKPQPPE